MKGLEQELHCAVSLSQAEVQWGGVGVGVGVGRCGVAVC